MPTVNHSLQTTFVISAIYACRLFGLFMVVPVFTLYAQNLSGATPLLIGIALGIYGASQAFLQIPFGILSDKYGRKPIITIGLIIFAAGSALAAVSTSIIGVLLGRILQGAGAIGSTLIALLADLTTVEDRTKSMAILGISIGLSFSLAMVIGPWLASSIGISGLFWVSTGLAMLGLTILWGKLPTLPPIPSIITWKTLPKLVKSVVKDYALLQLNLGIFLQHAILTATFVVLPIVLKQTHQFAANEQWMIFLPILLFSFLMSLPSIIIAERHGYLKTVVLIAIILSALGQGIMGLFYNYFFLQSFGLFIYFLGFNALEALLPSLVSRTANPETKGTAMGIYSSSQFLGICAGGAIGGFLYQLEQLNLIFLVSAVMALLWLFIASTMQQPPGINHRRKVCPEELTKSS